MLSMPAMRGVRTSQGVVPLWSLPLRGNRPLVFAIRGAFAPYDQLNDLARYLPEADVVVAHLPGLIGPLPADMSVPGFAATFREVLTTEFSGRPVTLVGASVGGLVALLLSDLGATIALDPPLSTAKLWPLEEWAASAQLSPSGREWLCRILGFDTEPVDRDYSFVLDYVERPVTVIAGAARLGSRRTAATMPSLLDDRDIGTLMAHPLIGLEIAPDAGHDIFRERPDVVVKEVRRVLTL